MIFRHLNLYQLDGDVRRDQIASILEKHPFVPCNIHEEQSFGFKKILGLDSRVYSKDGVHLFCLVLQEKIIPNAALRSEYQNVLEAKQSNGTRLSRDEKAWIKEEIRSEMVKKAFSKNTDVWAYVDNENQLLAINSLSQKNADIVANLLKKLSRSGVISPIQPDGNIQEAMTRWVRQNAAPSEFSFGFKCSLTDGSGLINYKNRLLSDKNLQEYLGGDMKILELELIYKDASSFTLMDDFLIKDFRLLGPNQPSSKQKATSLDEVASNLISMKTEVSSLYLDLRKSIDKKNA